MRKTFFQTRDGRGIYRSNYPENTSKDVKQRDIVELVQNVWSKKPIKLNLVVDGKTVPIEARFNPELTERSDLSKIAFGNRKGTASEKRITMNLSSDLYQIAEESHHVGSKTETGKSNAAHAGVTTWHYFLTDLVYVEADGTEIECYMNIDVKQNDSGHWFYSFAIEKGSRPADVLSVVTDESATTSTISITENAKKSNLSDENSSKNSLKKRFALSKNAETKIIHGYTLNKNANVNEDLLEELRIYDPTAEVSADGRITVYHRTSKESATAIRKTGIMRAKEDALFFSSKSEGYASDYGDTVLTFKIPSTQLRVNDIFDGEVHFDMPLKRSANEWSANVKPFIVDEDVRFALEDSDVDTVTGKWYNEQIKENGGKEDGREESQNTGVLERGGVSASRRGKNDIRQYSKNTQSLKGLLGYSDEYVRKNNIRAGETGWLENYQGANGYGDPNDKQETRRFLQGVSGRLSRTALRQTDSVGRTIPENILRAFSETVFKSDDGTILSLWHWTYKVFTKFELGDIGFHAGTFDASNAIMFAKSKDGETGFFKELYFNSKNPLFIDRDLMKWTPHLVAIYTGIFDADEIASISSLDGYTKLQYDSAASVRLRNLLKEKGYDSIIYTNDWEGGLSVIALDSEQFYIVAENGIDLKNTDTDSFNRRSYSLDIDTVLESTKSSVMLNVDQAYKPNFKDKVFSGWTATKIVFVNEQAGIEAIAKRYGIKNIESFIQAARSAGNQAEEMIAGNQYRIGADSKTYQGEGLEKIFRPIYDKGDEVRNDFYSYLFNYHNISCMTLNKRSIEWNEQASKIITISTFFLKGIAFLIML